MRSWRSIGGRKDVLQIKFGERDPTMSRLNSFGARARLGEHVIYRLDQLASTGIVSDLDRLPFSIRILLESLLRNEDGQRVTEHDVVRLAAWDASRPPEGELAFMPGRVVMQDFTGVPCVADLAAMRDAISRLGRDPGRINPRVPVDLVIDHTVMTDFWGAPDAARKNTRLGYERNRERYEFLKWGSRAFQNLRVVPPATGIIHQVNLEYLAQGVIVRGGEMFPDTVVGTDSHTPMINGLGVVGWGVGGIEAEAAMLGQPVYIVTPQVIGFRLSGALREGVTATDLVLTVTQMLRRKGVVDKFVEFCGPGLSTISLPDRATIANMAPEYGATMGFFPTDAETVRFLRDTGRGQSAEWLERYAHEQGLFRTDASPTPVFSDMLAFDLADVVPSLAGPKKPEERIAVHDLKARLAGSLTRPVAKGGYGLDETAVSARVPIVVDGQPAEIGHGAVVLAAITSCTNTSNPSAMITAGLLAKKAVERGLAVKSHIQTSLSPGSQVVTAYLNKAGLTPYLEKLGFFLTGYGCAVCVVNSGPLPEPVAAAIEDNALVVSAVVSGNRNFEGRLHPLTRANWLASPPLVIAYALAGTTDIDLETDPLGASRDGEPVFLRDIWPAQQEIAETQAAAIDAEMFTQVYADVFDGDPMWNAVAVHGGELFTWDPHSTYLKEPPFLAELKLESEALREIRGARVLALFGDGITTDHISPVGNIAVSSPAARYLMAQGVEPVDFNQYGTRRGNHEVMMRGAFANIRLKNQLLPGVEGGYTVYQGAGESFAKSREAEVMSIYDAAMRYKAEGTPLIVIAGKEYGMGSSRDWAAKAPLLLGVRAILAGSFERIHRSNLVGMGVLPLQFKPGQTADSLGLTGRETYDILGFSESLTPRQEPTVRATRDNGEVVVFDVIARLDTPVEVDYCRHGGILPKVLRSLLD